MMNHITKNFIFGILLLIASIIGSSSDLMAQDEKRSSNDDLRSRQVIFSVSDKREKLSLESSGSGEFSLSKYKGEDLVKVWKVDRSVAQTMDDNFADKFIRLKYEMKAFEKKACSSIFDLEMRGEVQKICKGEKEKKDIIEKLIGEIKKKFS
ncbi:MAG: hypothetical protein CME65_00555 [Halobacteriovoraceae bacterium]|nr:hypothetical protein [Halobacteriovoraceae bacterium]